MYAMDNEYLLKDGFYLLILQIDILYLIMVNVQDYNNKSGYECF